jgi:hypothetical protein
LGEFNLKRTKRLAVLLAAIIPAMAIAMPLRAGVLVLEKSQDKPVVSVGDTVNYCITINPQYVTPKADIIWVIDRSGSMNIGINNIIANLDYFTQQLSGRHVDYRNGLLTFVDGWFESYGFAENDTKFKTWLAGIPCVGGIEQDLEALYEANKFPWRPDASKTMILITDEAIPCSEANPPSYGPNEPLSLSLTATDLYSQGVIIHAITFNPSRYGTGDLDGKCNPIYLPPLAGGIWLDYNTAPSGWNVFLQILGEAIATMNNFVLRDPLPPQLAPVAGQLNGGTVNGNQIVWNYDQIDRGSPFQVCFNAVVTAPFSGQLINTAYGSADGITETSSNDVYLLKATETVTPTYTMTYTCTDTPTCTATPSITPTFTASPTYTPSITRTNSMSPTCTMTYTCTITQSMTYTCSPTFTCTVTGTGTYTVTCTRSPTPTYTATLTPTNSASATLTGTGTCSASPTYTYTASPTYTITTTGTPPPTGTATPTPTPTATKDHDHFTIIAPATVKAGAPFFITVTAMTSAMYGGVVADNYSGTLHLGTSSVVYTLPDDYAYVPATDAGSHIFQVVLMTPGTQAITGIDVVDTYMTGMTSVLVTAGDATTFTINAPSSVYAGQVFYITVTAKDMYNNVVTGYTGTVSFSSTDPQWVSPGDTQFTAADMGKKILAVTMKTAGIQRIYCQDIAYPSINGTSNDINVLHGPLNKFLVAAPSTANAGVGFNFIVTAQDQYNNTIIDYTGTVHLTTTDTLGVMPADYTFQLSDSGSRIFAATLSTNGIQTITAVDTAATTVTGTSNNINVMTPAASYSQPLLLTSYLTAANRYEFVYIYVSNPANTAIPANSYLEYDVFMPSYNADFYTGTEFAGSWAGGDMRDYGQATQSYIIDQNGIRCHPSMDLGAYAAGRWYHRKFNISALNGSTYNQAELSQDTGNIGFNGAPSNKAGTFNAVYDNIQFKDASGNVLKNFFANFSTIPFNNSVMVDGNVAGNQGNGGISPNDATRSTPLNNYIWVVKDYSLAQSPAGNIIADGASSCTITAHLYAPDNTPIGYALVDFMSNRAEDTVAPVAVSLNTGAITDWSGNAFARISSTKAGSANITARSAHISKIITVNFIAGPAAKVNLNPASLSMQTGMTGTLYASITDMYGNFVSDTRNITVSSSSGTMQFSADNGSTWAAPAVFQGTSLKSLLVRDSVSNTATVTAAAPGLTPGVSTIYINNIPASYLVVQPVTSTAAAGAAYAIAVQAKDAGGNNAFSNNSVQVTSASGTMKFSVDQATWSQSLNVSLNNGRANLYYMDTVVAGGVTMTAHDISGAMTDGKGYATIVAGQAAILSAVSNKYSVAAGQWVTITAQVTDAYGNAIAGQWVTGTALVQTGKTQNALVSSTSNTTNAAGQVTIWFKVSTDATGSMDYCVINSPGLLGTTITISASAAAGHLAFLPAPMSEGADKIGTLYINAKDANGYDSPATVSPDYVTVSANSANVVFSLDKVTWSATVIPALDASGAAVVYVKCHVLGTYTLTAHDGHITDATDTLTVVTGYFISVLPSVNSNAAAASGVTITAQVVDQNGTAVAMQGVQVDFSTNNGSINPLETNTDATGKATAMLTLSILAGVQHQVTVKMTNPDDTEMSGIITTVPVVSFAVSAPASVYRGQPFTVNVRAKDAYGATVDSYNNTVTFSSTDPAAALPANYLFTAGDSGVHAFSVTLNTDGLKSITVAQSTDASVSGTSQNILVIEPPTATCTSTPTRTATGTYTATPSVTQTITPSFTLTATPTITQTGTGTATPTTTPTATGTCTFTSTGTYTFTATVTPTYTVSPTFTQTPSCTGTGTTTVSPTCTDSVTDTPTYTATNSSTVTLSSTVTQTFTVTEPYTATVTPTITQTVTATISPSITPSVTPTVTVTGTPTFTASPTSTNTVYLTYTVTQTSSVTKTITPTVTPTLTQIPLDAYEYDGDYQDAKPIYSWQNQRHNIVPQGDADWLVFTLTAASQVTIETSGDAVDTEMWLYNSAGVASGTSLAYDDDGGVGACSKIEQMLPAGTYYVKIQDYENDAVIPEYYVSLTVFGPDSYENDNTYTSAKYITNGETQIHSIFPMTDVDWVKFDVTTPSYVDIKTNGDSSGDTEMWLYSSAGVPGTALYYNDDIWGGGFGYNYYSEITANLIPGTYYVKVDQNGQNAIIGSYSLSLDMTAVTPTPTFTPVLPDMYEADNTFATAKTILSGVQQEHSINVPTDVDWVKFDVTQNSNVTINTSGVSGNTVIYLYNSADTYMAMNDNDGLGGFSGLTMNNMAPGTYYVEVMQNGQNAIIPAYYIAVDVNVITPTCTPTQVLGDMYEVDDTYPNASVIKSGDVQQHSIHVPTDVDWVKFTVTQESMVHIWTTGSLSDTEMYLYNDLGVPNTPIAYDDNGGAGFFSSITMHLMPGIYYAEVNQKGKNQTIDQYQINLNITVITPTPTQTPVPPDMYEPDNVYTSASWIYDGMQQQHTIDTPSDTDWVKFTIGVDSMVNIQTSGPAGSTAMWLYSSAGVPGAPLTNNDGAGGFAGISQQLAAGTYYVKVQESGQDAVIPQYFITLSVSHNTPTVTPTNTATVTATSIYADMYEPDNTAAQANVIYPGVPQTHSIMPAYDQDWVKFTLTNTSLVVLSAIGPGQTGDTGLYLYTASNNPNGPYIYDDDSGGLGVWSMITTTLPPGTYYARVVCVDKYYGFGLTVPSYDLTLMTSDVTTLTPTLTMVASATYTPTRTQTATLTMIATATCTMTPTMSLNEALDNYTLVFNTAGNANWAGENPVSYYGGDAAQSGAIGNNMQTYISATVNGPGTLSFYWKVSSQPSSDTLSLYVDGVNVQSISGEVDWTQVNYTLTAGSHSVRWEYAKDGSGSAGQDTAWLDKVVYAFMTATPTPFETPSATPTNSPTATVTISFEEGVDSTGIVYASYGANPWFGETAVYDFGGDAGQSGHAADNQFSYVETTLAGPGNLNFYWKVSSQANSDYLRMYVDGVIVQSISGEVDWTQVNYLLGTGDHVIRWMYAKDASGSAGSDCGWLDNISYVQYTPTITRTGTGTPTVTYTRTATPTFTQTRTATPTGTVTPTFTNSPFVTPTPTYTISPTWTITRTFTASPTPGVWTANGLWHQVPDAACPAGKPDYNGTAWYYGQDSTLTYDTGAPNTGDLITQVYYNLAPNSTLTFSSWEQTENSTYYDARNVYISTDNGATWTLIRNLYGNENVWYTVTVSLAAYAGSNVEFRFNFNTIDAVLNDFRGWYVDDVAINAPAATMTATVTVSATATATATVTPTDTASATASQTLTVTISGTITQTNTITRTVTVSPTYTVTPTNTPEIWTVSGLWHQVPDSAAPPGDVSSSPSAWYYGQDATLNYDTGSTNEGDLISPVYHNLAPGMFLNFSSWEETENSPGMDTRDVYISTNNGGSWMPLVDLFGTEDAWYPVSIDLSMYAGQDVMFEFEFNTVDDYANDFRGWYVDNISLTGPSPTVTPTGSSTRTNTATRTATPSASATASMSPTISNTTTWTASVSPTVSNTGTQGATATATISPSVTASVSPTSTYTGIPTATCTITQTATSMVTGTGTSVPSSVPSLTMTTTETATATESITGTPPTATETATVTETITGTPPTVTASPSGTAIAQSPSVTPTTTETATIMSTSTSVPSMTVTATYTVVASETPSPIPDTPTLTITGTPPTITITPTVTESMTGTPPTGTATPSITESQITSPISTATNTATVLPTFTVTLTITGTPATATGTASETLTPIPDTPTLTITGTPPTATPSVSSTESLVPSVTNTVTLSITGTPPTATETSTGTASETPSPIPDTPTLTITGTPPTVTITSTVTETITGTPPTGTATPSVTSTESLVSSETSTVTLSITGTPPTATATSTAAVSETQNPIPDTPTLTITGTPPTATSTESSVQSPVSSVTFTATFSITGTPPTATSTYTITETITGTPPTSTITQTVTETITGTPATGTATPLVSSTDSPVSSVTSTETISITGTPPTVTETATVTETITGTPPTAVPSVSSTGSPTPSPMATASSVPSATAIASETPSPIPNTPTLTITGTPPTVTITPTVTESMTGTPLTATSTYTVIETLTSTPPAATGTNTVTVLPTFTAAASETQSPIPDTPTLTITGTPPTVTITLTVTETITGTPATGTITGTSVPTSVPSLTITTTETATVTVSITGTPPTVTETATVTETITGTPPTATSTYTTIETLTSTPPAATGTNTATVLPTFTVTASETQNPIPDTPTLTITGTPPTVTITPTVTETITGTPATATVTASETQNPIPDTPTLTITGTPPTVTITLTVTETITGTPATATGTASETPSPIPDTPTLTITSTDTMEIITPTMTETITGTPPTFTDTETPTITPTITATISETITETASATDTATPSSTRTKISTRTFTPTFTVTATITETATGTPPTPTVSQTVSPTVTGTPPTPTITLTITRTSTPTRTITGTPPTVTLTSTATVTVTVTITVTRTKTLTLTPTVPTVTYTATRSATATSTVPTSTVTLTPTPSATPTIWLSATITETSTPVPTATEGIFEITGPMIYPNPVNPVFDTVFMVTYYLTQDAASVKLIIYTSGLRLVRRVDISGPDTAGLKNKPVPVPQTLGALANGAYYYYFEAKSVNGKVIHSKLNVLVVLK